MNTHLRFLVPTALLAFALVGCSREDTTAAPAASAAGSTTVQPTSAPAAERATAEASTDATTAQSARVVEIEANDQMKFSVTRIEAKPGEQLQIKLTNVGTLPKTAMGHNLVLLNKGANAQAYANTAITAAADNYLPKSLANQVIAATKMLGPKESDTISITVPSEPGEYPFLCSFPAHFAAGMRGTLVVK